VKRYRVETVHWTSSKDGARRLEQLLNEWADEGWELDFIVPTQADTSVRALVGAASAGTSEIAVVLRRQEGDPQVTFATP
jgi:hypothetical protein